MTLSEVRERYVQFYKNRGHIHIPSAPIRPENDPTTLFTSSGMQPLVPYLLGEDHPEGKRIVNSQTCFRSGDIEEVGDNRHTTFFEMLGNWSLGDYFKKEQLPWVFEFLTSKTEGLGLDPRNLYVTVFAGDADTHMSEDTEAVELWKNLFKGVGVDASFKEIGTEEEGYEKGMQENERIFSYGAKKNWWSRAGVPSNMPEGEPGGPDSEVFYDFGLPHDIRWGAHCHPNCDCGRFIEIGNSVFMQYVKNSDGTFSNLPKQNVDFGGGLERLTAATLSNPDVFLIDVFEQAREALLNISGKKYTDKGTQKSYRIILDHIRAATFMLAQGIKPSATEAGYVLRRLLRRAVREADRLGGEHMQDSVLSGIAESFIHSYAQAYPELELHKEVVLDEIHKEESQFRKTLSNGIRELEKMEATTDPFLLFTTYGFPLELTQEIAQEKGISISTEMFEEAMKKHQDLSRAGGEKRFAGGLADHAVQTVRYHTTHHILLAALQKVLGTDVKQRGSNITSERLRIDFAYGVKMTDEQKSEVIDLVNKIIREDLPVTRTVMPKTNAEELGAQMEFGVKYADTVSVYSIGPKEATLENPLFGETFSLEFCGGPHVENTKEIYEESNGVFKILKEEAVASGVRRIKAVVV
jgi:alanyl-tRNA synthetase